MANMSIILTQDVDKLGRAGEIVTVKPGYGRNFLLPRSLGLLATRGNVAQLEHHRRAIAREQSKIRDEYEALAKQLEGIKVSIARKAGKDEKLFGSVSNKDIVEALSAQNIKIDRRIVQLSEPIKSTGSHDVVVRFSADVSATLQVNVVGIG
ncbi:MAG: 50S ribosomal protein L9 [Nannocystales bacterium]|jgi:large subunit ribosomal protein L9